VTRVATFENYVEGDSFKPTLFDPISGILFHDATGGTHSFEIEYSSTIFGGGYYLVNGGYTPGAPPSWTGNFGFSADLPIAASRVSFDISYVVGDLSGVTLTGYDAANQIVAKRNGPFPVANPFTLEITSSQYDITHFTVTVNGVSVGYDNVSYTVVPEPGLVVGAVAVLRRRGRGS
jgi:hypothetical protein